MIDLKDLNEFSEKGYVILKNESNDSLNKFIDTVLSNFEGVDHLSKIHTKITPDEINALRMSSFKALNDLKDWENMYYSQFETILKNFFGSDISIQSKLNLSIQMPHDDRSTLMLHTDTLSGQSEYEVVAWTPLVDAYETNSMYIFEKDVSQEIFKVLSSYENRGMNELFEDYKSKAKFLEINKGQVLIFSSSLFHGNVINQTEDTRVSVNCRFKNLFSPEIEDFSSERTTGSFYKPLKLSPVTTWALKYDDDFVSF